MLALIVIAYIAGAILSSAWSLMLVIGILHNDWWSVIPPMGYGTAVTVVFVGFLVTAPIYLISGVLKGLND